MSEISEIKPSSAAAVTVSVEVNAPRETVWDVFLQNIDDWWSLAEFHCLPGDSKLTLEPHANGRLYETSEAGELLWANVLEVLRHERIHFKAFMGPPYARPCMSLILFTFEHADDATRVTVSDTLIGLVDDKTIESIDTGWRHLLEKGLKAWIER